MEILFGIPCLIVSLKIDPARKNQSEVSAKIGKASFSALNRFQKFWRAKLI